MLASGSGPLGALLVIAPLAAIPVFAIVGVPQFSPVAASHADEEGIDDLGLNGSPAAESPRRSSRRSTDDLFAPLESSSGESGAARRSGRDDDRERSGERRTAPHNRRDAPDHERLAPRLPREALEDFEEHAPSADGAVRSRSLPGFRDMWSDGSDMSRPSDQVEPPPGKSPSPQRATDETPAAARPTVAEPSGWQAAAEKLRELGVRKYRLDARIEEPSFLFRCVFATPENPQVTQLFEAEAETPLEAVEAVLRQIEEWRFAHDPLAAEQ